MSKIKKIKCPTCGQPNSIKTDQVQDENDILIKVSIIKKCDCRTATAVGIEIKLVPIPVEIAAALDELNEMEIKEGKGKNSNPKNILNRLINEVDSERYHEC